MRSSGAARAPSRPNSWTSRGAAVGIDLFSVDIVESGGRPFVVDMSSFPAFKGVPDAPLRVAQYVYAAAEQAARGKPVVPADSLTERSTWSLSSAPSARVARPRPGADRKSVV